MFNFMINKKPTYIYISKYIAECLIKYVHSAKIRLIILFGNHINVFSSFSVSVDTKNKTNRIN